MTRATNARRKGMAEIPFAVLPRIEPVEKLAPRRGETIRSFVRRSGWEGRGLPIVCAKVIGGKSVPVLRKDWNKKIRANDNYVFVAQPLGGGGGDSSRSIGALVALIAVIAIASLVAGPAGYLATNFGVGQVGLAISSAVIIAGGSFLISHFFGPKSGAKGDREDPLSINLSGNKARPQQPIPVHYGRIKFFPDFSTAPWADFQGVDQVFHGLYCLGVGEFEIEEIGLGTTPVWTATDGTLPDFPTFRHEVIAPDQPVTLFPANVAVSPDVTGQELPNPNASGIQFVGPFIINQPGTSGKEVSIDLVWPGGSYTMDGTNTRPATTTVRIDYRYVNDSGVPIGGVGASWATAYSNAFTMENKVAVRKTINFTLPQAGRVQIRVGRTENAITGSGTSACVWSGARLYIYGATTRPKVTQIAVQLVSDKQLSSYNSKQLYVIATRKIPVWTGTNWVDTATANPVWAAVDMWHNSDYGGGQSRSKIDLPAIYQQAAAADARGDTFNHRFTSESTVLDALTVILRSILSQPVYIWDRFTVIRDEERVVPRLLLTDFEIIRGSPSIVYRLQDDQTSDGTIVEYLEEQTWARADVSSSANLSDLVHPARVQIEGVTNRRQAVLAARYLAAVNRYRRTVLSLTVEAEGKLLRRGDLVAVQTEMPGTWGEAFRIESYNSTTRALTFHSAATWSATGNHYVRIKGRNGAAFGPVRVTKGATDNVAIIDATDLATVQTQQEALIGDILDRSSLEERPAAAFSPGQPREFLGLVTKLSNAGENRFSIDLVNDAPEIYEIDDTAVPVLPEAPALILPSTPGVITGIYASLYQAGITLTLSATWQPDPSALTYTAQVSLDDGVTWNTVYPAGYDTSFSVSGFGDRDVLLRIRGTGQNGADGPWSSVLVESPGIVKTTDALGIGLSPGAVEAQSFASGIEPIGVVNTLPTASGYVGPKTVYLTTNGKLYRYVDGAWTAGVSVADLVGQVNADQIAANAITAGKIAAGAVSASAISTTTLSAIAANLGEVTAGTARDSDSKFVVNFTSGYLLISD